MGIGVKSWAAVSARSISPFLGIALLFTCTWCSDFASLHSSDADPLLLYAFSRACGVLMLVVFVIKPKWAHAIARSSVALGGIIFFDGVASVVGLFVGLLPGTVVIDYVSVIGEELVTELLLVLWLSRCCSLEPRQTRVVFPAAYLFAASAYFILRVLDPIMVAVLLAVFPVVSGILLMRDIRCEYDASSEVLEDAQPVAWTFPLLPVVLLVIYKLIFYFSLSLTDGPSLYGPLGIAIISLIALVGTIFFFDRYSASLLYRLSLPFMVAGLLLLAWLHAGSIVATLLTNAGVRQKVGPPPGGPRPIEWPRRGREEGAVCTRKERKFATLK